MGKPTKVEVCANCSGFDVGELKGKVKAKIGCIGKCSRKNPDLNGKVYGFLNGTFTVCETKEAFFDAIDALDGYEETDNRNPLVDAFLEQVERWRPEHAALRALCLDAGMKEELKWGQPCYTYEKGNIVIIGGFKQYIALSFFKGALLKDEAGKLIRQTANVQAGRQLRFVSLKEIGEQEALIAAYLQEAMAIEKAGLDVPTEEKPAMSLPQELQAAFDAAPAFMDAFQALTPGRQRGYVLYFSGAKQSATRAARISKMLPKILAGKGLDD